MDREFIILILTSFDWYILGVSFLLLNIPDVQLLVPSVLDMWTLCTEMGHCYLAQDVFEGKMKVHSGKDCGSELCLLIKVKLEDTKSTG